MPGHNGRINRAGFRKTLKSPGVCGELSALAYEARARAEAVSGLRYGCGVDNDGRRTVSARAWVGTSANRNWGAKRAERFLARAAKGLAQALSG